MPPCPVCRAAATRPFLEIEGKTYRRCGVCAATFLEAAHHPDREAERAHYLNHENDPDDPRYRRFLAKLTDPLLARLPPAQSGLDFGCGPGSAVAAVMREAGHRMALYDPFFAPDTGVLRGAYDFVTCTEVAEHFFDPAEAFDRLARLLRPGGVLAVMTCFQTEDPRFADWHYRKDPTHVVFYRAGTFEVIANQRGLTCESPAKDVVFMRKPGVSEVLS